MVGRKRSAHRYEAQTTLPADGKPGPASTIPARWQTNCASSGSWCRRLAATKTSSAGIPGRRSATGRAVRRPARLLLREHTRCVSGVAAGALRRPRRLNRAWNARYGDWEAVTPDRLAMVRYRSRGTSTGLLHGQRPDRQCAARPRSGHPGGGPARPAGLAHKGAPIIGAGRTGPMPAARFPRLIVLPRMETRSSPGRRPPRGERAAAAPTSASWPSWPTCGAALRLTSARATAGGTGLGAEFQAGRDHRLPHRAACRSADMRRWLLTAVGSGSPHVVLGEPRRITWPSERLQPVG